jgi:tetratricopeptide (TPR) repeat protein
MLRVREIRTSMPRIDKTVFLSYRRTNAPWALSIYHSLTGHGYDVFFDFNGIASGDFESVILDNIRSRAHFIVLLTPSALERCGEPGDWLRREIEMALSIQRNIVPLMLEGFDFGSPGIASQLTGTLAPLRKYNALRVPAEYFDEAMDRLRSKFLNIPLDAVLHPASQAAAKAARTEQAAAKAAPTVKERELTAQEWFERGFNAADPDDKLRFYTEAIRLKPDYADAFYNRGLARYSKGDLEGAARDYDQATRLKPDYAEAFYGRGLAGYGKGDLDGALQDYERAIRLKPEYAEAICDRGLVRYGKGNLEGALQDYERTIHLKPDYAIAFYNRGLARRAKGDLDGALQDYGQAIRLKPDFANPYYGRALIFRDRLSYRDAVADFQRFLDLGGGAHDGFAEKAKQMIADLKQKL